MSAVPPKKKVPVRNGTHDAVQSSQKNGGLCEGVGGGLSKNQPGAPRQRGTSPNKSKNQSSLNNKLGQSEDFTLHKHSSKHSKIGGDIGKKLTH